MGPTKRNVRFTPNSGHCARHLLGGTPLLHGADLSGLALLAGTRHFETTILKVCDARRATKELMWPRAL